MSNNTLSPVCVEDIPSIRDMFLVEWPKYLYDSLEYTGLTIQILEKVQILLPYEDYNNGIVVIWNMVSDDVCDISLFCIGDCTKLKDVLLATDKINWSASRITFCCIREELYECCMSVFNTKVPQKKTQCDNVYVFHIDRDAAKLFEYEIPVWPLRYPGSETYFSRMIDFGLTSVLLGEKGDLRGWILNGLRGEEHSLEIKEEFKRQGQLLVKWLGKKLSNEGRDVFGCVVDSNIPSQNIFRKMNFKQLYTTNWIYTNNSYLLRVLAKD